LRAHRRCWTAVAAANSAKVHIGVDHADVNLQSDMDRVPRDQMPPGRFLRANGTFEPEQEITIQECCVICAIAAAAVRRHFPASQIDGPSNGFEEGH
jgi:hypothetical protein